jgi:hypothetical protein
MELTRSEQWALRTHRLAGLRSFAVDLLLCGLGFLTLALHIVGLFLAGQLTVVGLVGAELCAVLFGGVGALWLFERRGFVRLLDAKDREIHRLKGQRGPG